MVNFGTCFPAAAAAGEWSLRNTKCRQSVRDRER